MIQKLKCNNCGYEWYPRTEIKPKVCTRCKSYNWNKK